jgi:hypothetical protein
MALGQVRNSTSKTVLLKNFFEPKSEITFKAGEELQIIGFNDTHYQCLILNSRIVWIPKDITKTE